MLRVCFGRPRTIRGFNNHSFVKKYPLFSTQIQILGNPEKINIFKKINRKAYHYTMLRVCFGRPRTTRGFNNHSFVKKYPFFSTQIQMFGNPEKIIFFKDK